MPTSQERGLERPVPAAPWRRVLAVVAAVTAVAITGWELETRHLGLHAGDIGDGKADWAAERRKVDSGPRDPVVIIGDSRILFDTDLATWQRLTGRRPIQLALQGTNARPFLHDLAMDEHFAGLAVVGISPTSYFRDGHGVHGDVLDYLPIESPSQRLGLRIDRYLQRHLAFLDQDYTLFKLIEQREWPTERVARGDSPYYDVWKISETYDDRQVVLWDRIERDGYLREHARLAWNGFAGKPVAPDMIDKAVATTKADIDRIRARGGEVVWVRPPAAEPILVNERTRAPRAATWDRLLRETGSFGVHFEDYPEMQHLDIPEWSHLSRDSALRFTDAYVRALRDNVRWLRVRSEALPADARPGHD